MILPRLAMRILLALALVLAQQVGALHRLSHATEPMRGLAHESVCEACLAMVALDKPIVVHGPRLPAIDDGVAAAPAERAATRVIAGGRAAYRSRAPPALSS